LEREERKLGDSGILRYMSSDKELDLKSPEAAA
jgi:hypothetical protein